MTVVGTEVSVILINGIDEFDYDIGKEVDGYYVRYGKYCFPGVRPVICLKSGVKLQANANGGYDLIQPDVVVAENQATLEITAEESNSFDSLFTVTTKDGGTATRTYKLNGTTTNIRNTSELAVGTHTLECTATYNGMSDSAYMTIVVKAAGVPEKETLLAVVETDKTVAVTIPQGVSVIKIVFNGSATTSAPMLYGDEGVFWWHTYGCKRGNCVRHVEGAQYVGVTPGKTYNLEADYMSGNFEIYISTDINSVTPNVMETRMYRNTNFKY